MAQIQSATKSPAPDPRGITTRLRPILELVALVMIVAVCGAMLEVIVRGRWVMAPAPARQNAQARPADPPLPSQPISIDGAQTKGLKTAPVAVIEYSDFQCPYCGRFARDTFPAIDKAYIGTGKVLFAFREFPIESIHPHALPAAEAAECAAAQGQFWRMHELTFADQSHLEESALETRAKSGGLDVQQLHQCLASTGDTISNRIKADESSGAALAVSGTPTFFLGRLQGDGHVKVVRRLAGAVPAADFSAAIEAVLRSTDTAKAGTK